MNALLLNPDGPLTMSSREIAQLTGKRHADVMRDIRIMMDALKQNADLRSVCKSSTYAGENGQNYPQYELDKDTSLTLLLGYDPVARMKVVKRWQELEAGRVPQSFAQALRLAAEQQEQIEMQQAALEAARPKVMYADAMLNADGTVLVREAAKTIGVRPTEMYAALKKKRVLLANNAPAAEYIDKGYFLEALHAIETNTHGTSIKPVPRVTGKGLEFLRRFVGRHAELFTVIRRKSA